jgi:uncharacterized damage-inducible protein DinB
MVPVRIAPSSIHGLGIFAVEFIAQGTDVWRFTPGFDLDINTAVLDSLAPFTRERMLHFGYLDRNLGRFIVCCDDARFMNHSKLPNLAADYERDPHGIDYAVRDILPGEEITTDYDTFEEKLPGMPELTEIGPSIMLMPMTGVYRKGGVGAMMDEYERAAAELKNVLSSVSDEQFNRIVDTETKDEDCRSIQTIMRHVVRAGYGYANYIRTAWNIPISSPESVPIQRHEAAGKVDAFLAYTAQTLEGKWEMTDEDIQNTKMVVRWGPTYDLEQLMEHAIVHILRHRRQIERFLVRMGAM